jgi:acyl carrier protein
MQMSPEEAVRAFIADRFFFGDEANIQPAQSLIKTGAMDSAGVMELVAFLEDTFEIRIADNELVAQNLDSLRSIGEFVRRKLASAAEGRA